MYKKFLSILIAAAMLVLPLSTIITSESGLDLNSGSPALSAGDDSQRLYSDSDYEFFTYDEETGTLMLDSSILSGVFGTEATSQKPSAETDVINDAFILSPLEIAMWQGGSSGHYEIYDHSSSSMLYSTGSIGNTDSYHAVAFAAALSKNSNVYNTDGDVSWARDWICSLYYNNSNAHLHLNVQKTNGPVMDLDIDSLGITNSYTLDEINRVSSLQSRNILNYAVGDFDGDSNEDIAILHQSYILFFGLNLETGKLELMYKTQIPHDSSSSNMLYTPVSMSAGDIDGDGLDELIVNRGYFSNGTPGSNEYTMLGIIDISSPQFIAAGYPSDFSSDSDYCKWKKVIINDPLTGTALNSIMTSAVVADINHDSVNELVIGGYLWDNNNTHADYTRNPSYGAGELYIAYAKYDSANKQLFDSWNNVTLLMDDNGLATTRYDETDGDVVKQYDLEGHDVHDTSIFLEDSNDNPVSLCRAVNWCNWTIPMHTVSLKGYQNNCMDQQVFFDTLFYSFDTTYQAFGVYIQPPKLGLCPDNNNVICNGIYAGAFLSQNLDDYQDNHQELLIHYGSDLHEKAADDGNTEWAYAIYDGNAAVTYSTQSPHYYRDVREWGNGLYNVGRLAFGNFDDDSYSLTLLRHYFMYIDPVVMAFVSGIPCETDLAEKLVEGTSSLGDTSIIKISGSGSGSGTDKEWEAKVSFNVGGLFAKWFSASIGGGHWGEQKVTNTHTVTAEQTFGSSKDSVLLTTVPLDLYIYNIVDPSGNSAVESIPVAGDLITQAMDYDSYVEYITEYNDWLTKLHESCDAADELSIVSIIPSEHVQGDISTYTAPNPGEELFSPEDVGYTGTGSGSFLEVSLTIEDEKESEDMYGGVGELSLKFDIFEAGKKIGRHDTKSNFGIDISGEGKGATVSLTTDVTGMGYSSKINQAFDEYLIDKSEDYVKSLEQYKMQGTFWASKRYAESLDDGYFYVGYTVNTYTVGAKLGELEYIPYDPNNPDSKYNPTNDVVCFKAVIDNCLSESDIRATGYYIEYQYQGEWYKLGSTPAGDKNFPHLQLYEDAADGWTLSANDFRPLDEEGEQSFNVAVAGLSALTDETLNFRIVAYKPDVNNSSSPSTDGSYTTVYAPNPSLPVTAYKNSVVGTATVIYNSMYDGINSIAFDQTLLGETYELLPCMFTPAAGAEFLGWASAPDSSDFIDTVAIDELCTNVYAVWSVPGGIPSTEEIVSCSRTAANPTILLNYDANGSISKTVFSELAKEGKDLRVVFRDETGRPLVRLQISNITDTVNSGSFDVPKLMMKYSLPETNALGASGSQVVCLYLSDELFTPYDMKITVYTNLDPGTKADVYIFNEADSTLTLVAGSADVGAYGHISFVYEAPEKNADSNGDALAVISLIAALIVFIFLAASFRRK